MDKVLLLSTFFLLLTCVLALLAWICFTCSLSIISSLTLETTTAFVMDVIASASLVLIGILAVFGAFIALMFLIAILSGL